MKKRCNWVNLNNPLYVDYHDNEWSKPLHDDKKLFEFLILEGFQAGLSWECILNKRDSFRDAFDNFDVDIISSNDEDKINNLLHNSNIIRNRLKINAAIINARVFKDITHEFGSFDNYIWSFTDNKIIVEDYSLRTTSPLSDEISKDLKKRGMKFVGSTIIYSYLQAIGIIFAHGKECDFSVDK
jgi:DNA-3-methyladenine glycosylase I